MRRDGRHTAGGRGRGLLIYAREGVTAAELHLEGGDQVTECSGISLPWGRGEDIKIVLVYRPPAAPGSPADAGNSARLCNLLRTLGGRVVVVGDFNMPGIDWERGWSAREGERMLTEMVEDKFWHQVVSEPTHRLGNTLDLCLVSSLELVSGMEVIAPLGTSDHFGLEVNLQGMAEESSSNSKEEVPDWAKADMKAMSGKLDEVDWRGEFGQMGGLECMEKFYEVLLTITKECVPTKFRRTKCRPLWMNRNILRMLRRKRRLWRAYTREGVYREDFRDFRAHQELQKELRSQIKRAKRKLERDLARKAKKDPKKFYAYMKSKISNRVSVGPLKGEGGLVTDSKGMAEILNRQYTSVFTREGLEDMPEAEALYTGDSPLEDVGFEREEVVKKLRNIKQTGAPGPDLVWSKVLHATAEHLGEPLALIFNKLMREGEVPSVWRRANVCPIYKKGAKGDPANYRPVSLTCVVGKVMESMVRDRIVEHLERNGLIRPSQHGFMSGRSTVTNMLVYMEALTRWLDEGHTVDVLYLDFAKAFDKVPHRRLLDKCKGVGVEGKLLEWIRVWLEGRNQRVVLNGEASEWSEVLSGVLRARCWGPHCSSSSSTTSTGQWM